MKDRKTPVCDYEVRTMRDCNYDIHYAYEKMLYLARTLEMELMATKEKKAEIIEFMGRPLSYWVALQNHALEMSYENLLVEIAQLKAKLENIKRYINDERKDDCVH